MIYLVTYLIGVFIGLAVMRDPWPLRVGTAVVWPLGPLAFVVVIAVLALACAVLWPLPALALATLLGALAWWLT